MWCFTIAMTILREIGSTLTRRTLPPRWASMGEGRVGVIAPQYKGQQTTVMRLLSAINKTILFFISDSPRRPVSIADPVIIELREWSRMIDDL